MNRIVKCSQCQAENPADQKFCGNCAAPLYTDQDLETAPTRTMITPKDQLGIGGTFADRYHIIEELGKGGMGRVFKVLDSQIDEKIALKLLNPDVASDETTQARFRNELKITRQISHRHICRVYDFSEVEGHSFITMEYVSGEDLKSLIRRIGELTPGKAIFIARQICEGLAEAHRLGVIHRDLKPHNIMIDREGNVRIMDFGIARSFKKGGVTDTGVIIGTPEYMSPEQVEGEELDSRSDIYSLGIILYEMLTGQVPFKGETPLSVAVKQKTEQPRDPKKLNPQISAEISRLILRCLEKDRQNRFQNSEELLAVLQELEKGLPTTDRIVPERQTGTAKEITVKLNLRKLYIPALIVIAVFIIGFLGWQLLFNEDVALLASDKPTLAVLHFENNTGDAELEHWRKAISDLLIADLGQSRFIQVLSAERLYNILEEMDLLTARSYSSDDLNNIANRAGVQYVLVGKMTQAGETIRLNTTLQEAQSGTIMGQEQVEGQGEESLFDLVDQLTTSVKADFNLSADKIASDIDAAVQSITTTSTEAHRYYQEGMKFHNAGDYTKSIPLMELAVAIDPDFAMAYRAMSIAYGNLGYTNEAENRLEKAFELSDRVSERERHYIQADYFRQSEDTYGEAIDAYSKLLAVYPDDTIGNNNLGVVFLSIEETDKAIKRFETNVRNYAPNFHSYSNLSETYLKQGQFDKARQINELYLQNISDHPTIHSNLSRIYLMQQKYSLALEEAEKAKALNPSSFEYYKLRGTIFEMQGLPDQAEAEYQQLLEVNEPVAHHMARNALFSLFLKQGKFVEAEDEIRQGIELADLVGERGWEVNGLLNLAYLKLSADQLNIALQECERALDLAVAEQNIALQREALHWKGLIQAEQNQISESRTTAQDLYKLVTGGLNQKIVRLYYHLNGKIQAQAGNYADAIQNYEQALALLNRIDGGRLAVLDSMAMSYQQSGELDRARRTYTRIIRNPLAPMLQGHIYTMAYYRLAKISQELGRREEARGFFQKFLEYWEGADADIAEFTDAQTQLQNLIP